MKFEEIDKLYLVTEDGKVINRITKKVKKTYLSKNGYERVTLWNKGKQYKMSIHRLVATKYIPNLKNLPQVNHKDGNKTNNSVSNLEWCTQSENMKHAYKNNLINSCTTKILQYDLKNNFIKEWNSVKDASEKLNINHANICTVASNKTNRKQAGGYIWRYKEEII